MDSVISRLIIRDTPRIMWSRHSMAVAAGSLSAAFGWATANTHSRHARNNEDRPMEFRKN
jgi:hypothetical protein